MERDERLALKRARGESYLAIAAAEGIPVMTVYDAVARQAKAGADFRGEGIRRTQHR